MLNIFVSVHPEMDFIIIIIIFFFGGGGGLLKYYNVQEYITAKLGFDLSYIDQQCYSFCHLRLFTCALLGCRPR